MAKKQLSKLECVYYSFMGIVLAFGAICFIMAFVMMLSRPAYAGVNTNVEYEYFIGDKNEQIDMKVTEAVCSEVGSIAGGTKALFELGLSDEAIQETMINVSLDNLSSRNTWIAFHVMIPLATIATMRGWADDEDFQWIRSTNPGLDERQYFQVFAEDFCKKNKLNTMVQVLKVERRAVKVSSNKLGRPI